MSVLGFTLARHSLLIVKRCFALPSSFFLVRKTRGFKELQKGLPMSGGDWKAHAYPLQQVTIKLQGTRHSDRESIVRQLETVLVRLRSGDIAGEEHDDDFGYTFTYSPVVNSASFFDEPAGAK
jgi:hypothetical protein